MPDPRNASDYAFAAGLDGRRWAWEFLRRSPAYRRDWAVFHSAWVELESLYGSPPNRDFAAWKRDPRAWVPVAECPDGVCRVDQDKVLIECALGARYGFHKFPPDPADDDPVGEGRLSWRERPPEPPSLPEPGDLPGLAADPAFDLVVFDLRLPLREQLEQAKRRLQSTRRRRVREGVLAPHSVAHFRDLWTRCLRLLDAESMGLDDGDFLGRLAGDRAADDLRGEAHRLRDGGYLEILRLPEGPAEKGGV